MSSWLVDDPTLIYMLLGTAAVAFAVLWWKTRKTGYAYGAGTAVALMGALFLLGTWVDTDQKRLRRALEEMAAGVTAHDLDRVFEHISADFQYRGHDKLAFRLKADEAIRARHVESVQVWDFEPIAIDRPRRSASMAFRVKGKGNWSTGKEYYRCLAEFVLDPDSQWRMRGFKIFNPLVETDQEIAIPGF
jgi:hypothetical protein